MIVVLESILVGLAIGAIVGVLGAGGGILSVPVLVYLLGQSPHDAAAGSLVIVALTACVSLVPQRHRGTIQWRDGVLFGLVALFGSALGSRLSVLIDAPTLMLLFGLLLLAVAAYMLRRAVDIRARERAQTADEQLRFRERSTRKGLPVFVSAALVTGFVTGFFGVGGGFIVVPMLVLALGFRMKVASATSLVVMIIAATGGMLARIGTDVHIDWNVVIPFAVASMIGGAIGSGLNGKFRDSSITAIFAAVLAAVGATVLGLNVAG